MRRTVFVEFLALGLVPQLCVEAPGRELGVRAHEHRVAVAGTGVLRVLLHVRVQREDERTTEAEAAAVREDGEAAELVVAGVLRAADGADGGERGREPEEEVRRGRVEVIDLGVEREALLAVEDGDADVVALLAEGVAGGDEDDFVCGGGGHGGSEAEYDPREARLARCGPADAHNPEP